MTRPLLRGAFAGALLLAPAHAQTGGHDAHAGHGTPAQPMSMADMNAAMLKELRPLKGRAFDIRWTQLMTDHHAMALDMARQVLAGGKSALVKAEAKKVVADQQREINQMAAWLKTWTGKAYKPTLMPMKGPGTGSVDRWFLTEMIPHHQGAIDMSALVAGRRAHPGLTRLAAQITRAQKAEIVTYRKLLKTVK